MQKQFYAMIFGFIFIAFLKFNNAQAQEYTNAVFAIVDSSRHDGSYITYKIKWDNEVIELRKTINFEYDLERMRKFARDSTFVPTENEIKRYKVMKQQFGQNCHSYALEKYFVHNNIKGFEIFNDRTALTSNGDMYKILNASFKKISTYEVKRKKCKKCDLSPNSLIVFKTKTNPSIHSIFYDGKLFFSKNGGWPAKTEVKIKPLLKIYFDTIAVDVYRFNTPGE